jgi:hypothetical protein
MKRILVIGALSIVLMFATGKVMNAQSWLDVQGMRRNHIGVELGGVLQLYGITFERMTLGNMYHKLNVRLGISYLPFEDFWESADKAMFVAYGLNYLWGEVHHLEVGINGRTGFYFQEPENGSLAIFRAFSPSIGYRFEDFTKKSIYISVSFSPVYQHNNEAIAWEFKPWGRLGIGYSF